MTPQPNEIPVGELDGLTDTEINNLKLLVYEDPKQVEGPPPRLWGGERNLDADNIMDFLEANPGWYKVATGTRSQAYALSAKLRTMDVEAVSRKNTEGTTDCYARVVADSE